MATILFLIPYNVFSCVQTNTGIYTTEFYIYSGLFYEYIYIYVYASLKGDIYPYHFVEIQIILNITISFVIYLACIKLRLQDTKQSHLLSHMSYEHQYTHHYY